MNTPVPFLNASNGLLSIGGVPDPHVIRIQSTACEQKRWGEILLDLDYDFLFALASGNPVRVVDHGARHDVPRALWQGLAWVKYAVTRRWFGLDAGPVWVKGRCGPHNAHRYFQTMYDALPPSAFRKLDYVKRFQPKPIDLSWNGSSTTLDGNTAAIAKAFHQHAKGAVV